MPNLGVEADSSEGEASLDILRRATFEEELLGSSMGEFPFPSFKAAAWFCAVVEKEKEVLDFAIGFSSLIIQKIFLFHQDAVEQPYT
jgi:hypothetical protein